MSLFFYLLNAYLGHKITPSSLEGSYNRYERKHATMKKVEEAQPNYYLKNLRLMRNWTQADVTEKINTTSLNVSRWERGILVPCLHYRQKLCELFGKSSAELGLFREEESPDHAFQQNGVQNAPVLSLGDAPHYWHVPYQRNPFFTGHEEILLFLHEMLQKKKNGAFAQSYALSGPGGIGKTQIALEYVYRSASAYDAIFWIDAGSRENILADFSSIAAMLNFPEKDDQDQNRMLNAVKRWLHTHKHWLLIFDDIEDPELVKGFLPAARNSTLLLTTQRATLGMIALPLELEPMSQVEATQLLLQRAQFLERGASPEQIAPADALIAQKIAQIMDGLPLALDQAGAYIAEHKCSLAEFLHLFQEHPLQLLDERGFCTDHPLSVVETFSLAVKKI